jgi:hypothetical protein
VANRFGFGDWLEAATTTKQNMYITVNQYNTVIDGLRTQLELMRAQLKERGDEGMKLAERAGLLERKLDDRTLLIQQMKIAMSQLNEVKFSPSKDRKMQRRKCNEARESFGLAMDEYNKQGFRLVAEKNLSL